MRTLSILAFTSFLILWGVYSYLKDEAPDVDKLSESSNTDTLEAPHEKTIIHQQSKRDLDKIGTVINESNADIDSDTRNEIKVAKKVFVAEQNLKEKQKILEQSFMDRASSIKDIKNLQNEIVEMKNKIKSEPTNTEKWDPKFIYYLMMQENYTYQEINGIKSLSENGLNPEEINYITELIKEDAFMERITSFKGQSESGRSVASLKKKEKDDFIDDPQVGASLESKLIEMDYNKDEHEEMVYGNQQ